MAAKVYFFVDLTQLGFTLKAFEQKLIAAAFVTHCGRYFHQMFSFFLSHIIIV